jgi:hypothetical protein
VLVLHTSVGDFCGYLEQIVVPDVSVWVSFRHLVSVAAFCGGFFGGLMDVEGGKTDDGAIGNLKSGCEKAASRPDCEEGAVVCGLVWSLEGSWSRTEL